MKLNNKTLAIIFFVLLGIWLMRKVVFKPVKRSFRAVLVQIDTAKVDKIVLFPKGADNPSFSLSKSGADWKVSDGNLEVSAESNSINGILQQLISIPTKQLISKNPEKHVDYGVDNTAGKLVEIYGGNKLLEKFVVGRFNFNQNTRQAISYARLFEEEDIYSIDGFLSMTFDRDFNSFRNRKLFDLNPSDVKSINIQSNNTTASITKATDNSWLTNSGIQIDSADMQSYLSSLSSTSSGDFYDQNSPSTSPLTSLQFTMDNTIGGITLDIYPSLDTASQFIVKSSQNDAFFSSDSSGIFTRLVMDLEKLLNE